jgi:hypothetical protein
MEHSKARMELKRTAARVDTNVGHAPLAYRRTQKRQKVIDIVEFRAPS